MKKYIIIAISIILVLSRNYICIAGALHDFAASGKSLEAAKLLMLY